MAGCGDNDAQTKTTSIGSEVDRAFVAEMAEHDEIGVEMARLAEKNGETSFVRQLADDIIARESRERDTMQDTDAALAASGLPVGELELSEDTAVVDINLQRLRRSFDAVFDMPFIDMMVSHHQVGIQVAREELENGANKSLLALAEGTIVAQSTEIEKMNAHREQAFGAPSPAGGVPPAAGE